MGVTLHRDGGLGLRVAPAASQRGNADFEQNMLPTVPFVSPPSPVLEMPAGTAMGRLGPGQGPAWSWAQKWWAGSVQGLPARAAIGPYFVSPEGSAMLCPLALQRQHQDVNWMSEPLSQRWQACGQGSLGTC